MANTPSPYSSSTYSAFDYKETDLQITRSTTVDKSDNRINSTQYHAYSNMDLAWMNAQIALQGDRKDGLAHSHIRLDRYFLNSATSNQSEQEGYISYLAIGDLDPQGLELTHKNRGRGFLITNQSASPSHSINQRSLEGNGFPGWQVELFNNGIWLDTIKIGQDGRYQFDNLKLFLGKNTFVLKWTAPNGAQYSETKTIYKGSDITQPDQVAYRFSVIQPERSTVNSTDPSDNPQNSNAQVNLHWAYRLNSMISLDMGAQHTDINDQSENNVQAGLQARLNSTTLAITGNKPNKSKARIQYEVGHHIAKTRLLFSHTSGFTPVFISNLAKSNTNSSSVQTTSDQNESLYRFDIDSALNKTPVRFTATRFKSDFLSYQQYQFYVSSHQAFIHKTGEPSKNLNWFNRLAYTRTANQKDWAGELTTRFLTQRHRSDLILDYKLNPDIRLNHARFSHYLTLSSTPNSITKTYFDAKHQFEPNKSEYTLGVSWQNRYLRITPEFSYASGDIKSGKITFNTNLYKDRKSNRKPYRLKPHSHIDKESKGHNLLGVTR